MKILRILAAWLLLCGPVLAQVQIGSGQVWGNSTAARAPGKSEAVTAILDRALGSTRGAMIERGASGWGIVGPGTAGLPWVSLGPGADPLYQLLGVVGGGTGINVYAIGDVICAAGTTTLSRIADIATGNALISGGVGACPSYGKITSAHLNITTTTCTNQYVSAISATAGGTCASITLAQLPSMAANTVLSNWTAGAATPLANTWPACANDGSHALVYINGTGLQCATIASGGTVTTLTAGTGISFSSGATLTTTGTITNSGVVTVKKQVFTASGTYTPSTGMLYAQIECIGGGGAGGGLTSTTSALDAGGGGGSGSYSRILLSAATIGASKSVTVGAGGTGVSNGTGNAGGDSCVGGAACTTNLCVGKGGSGGAAQNSGRAGVAGAGGVAGTGDVAIAGSPGHMGLGGSSTIFIGFGGRGGDGFFGGGGISPTTTAGNGVYTGNAASTNSGGGGSGAAGLNSNTTVATGGAGAAGIVIVTEYNSQ